MKHLLSILLLIIAFSTQAQAQIKMESGLLLNGGKGTLEGKLNPIPEDRELKFDAYDNKAHFSIGYRLRLKPVKSAFFYDIDLNVGARLWEYRYYAPPVNRDPLSLTFIDNASPVYAYGSLAGSANYRIYKGLSVGLGIEPVYYFFKFREETNRPAFGIPLVGKVAYNLKFIEIGFSYKYSLVNTIKSDAIKSANFNDWQLSLFIPF